MQRFEYRILDGHNGDTFDEVYLDDLNDMGERGWEVVSASWGLSRGDATLVRVLLKRPLREDRDSTD